MKKYHIKRNSVQETLLHPLYARSKRIFEKIS